MSPSLRSRRSDFDELPTPCLLLDRDRLDRNTRRMRKQLDRFAIPLRPHLKTAKSIEVTRRVLVAPQEAAMVSTLREAEFYASHGLRDLIYGVGIAPPKLSRVGEIRARYCTDLTVVLDSVEQAEAVVSWSRENNHALPVLIEVDVDGHRSGVRLADSPLLIAIGRKLVEGGAILRGVMTHAGASYNLQIAGDLIAAAAAERATAVRAAEMLRAVGLACPIVSIGSTPTASFARDLTGVTEVRAGVFMFGDLVQAGIGTCGIEDIAVSVLATVIGHSGSQGRIMIDSGWMALSQDRGTSRQTIDQHYGLVCDEECRPYPDLLVLEANQEHGTVGIRPGSAARLPDLPIGSLVRVLPNHACATAAQHDRYHVLVDGSVVSQWPRVNGW
jgi:D-serine deaminase-like pyridoxal phosphate-dependent protein